ncbi:MAG: hypothetical protein HFG15_03525 [Bacilli bacterium]|nr:hypothetical protein [Bacilli bacterium]
MEENKKLIFKDYVLENKDVRELLKERGIDVEAHPDRYKIEYEAAMDDGYDQPISSYSVYEVTPRKKIYDSGYLIYRKFPNGNGSDGSYDDADYDYTKQKKERLEKQKRKKVVRVTKKVANNASKLLALAALVAALTAPIGFVNTYHNRVVKTSVPVQKVVTTESNVYDELKIHDGSSIEAGTDFYEVGNRTGDTAKMGSNSSAMPGNYEISGFAIYDENNYLVDSFVDLNRTSYDVNLGSSINKICEQNGLDPSKVTVALHLGSEVDGSTLGWFDAKDILGHNLSVSKSEVVTSYETKTSIVKEKGDKVFDYSIDHVTPTEAMVVASLAGLAAGSAFANKVRNGNNGYRLAEEAYRKNSLFEKLKSKLFSKKSVAQSLSSDQVTSTLDNESVSMGRSM